MRVEIGKGFWNISFGGDTSESDEEWEVQNCSYNDPNDGIPTPQEPQIRQEETRIEQANSDIKQNFIQGQVAAVGAGVGVASGMPIETAIAGGTVLYSYQNMKEAYSTREEAKERYDQKVEEEKQYLNEVKNN